MLYFYRCTPSPQVTCEGIVPIGQGYKQSCLHWDTPLYPSAGPAWFPDSITIEDCRWGCDQDEARTGQLGN